VLSGAQSLEFVSTLDSVDSVMAAIVGAAGLLPSLAAAKAGKVILLANKEALVMSGDIFMQAVTESGAQLLPIDSEHNAIFQCMPAGYKSGMHAKSARRILLTASGGPFREMPIEQLINVTPAQAVAHPNWDMGRKISVDSATMMNKGLEMIEACILFAMRPDQIQVVIHPQSIIHSMVDYIDGTVLAQMGNPDMRVPIAYSMAWPERFESGVEPLNIFDVRRMDFEEPNLERFPCLRLAYKAINLGGIIPTVLNAANEVAVDAFLNEQVRFTDIPLIIERCIDQFEVKPADTLALILEADKKARIVSKQVIAELTH
jgi:1-deoxy-D-xylulose-5-phosphate reductoisomerase